MEPINAESWEQYEMRLTALALEVMKGCPPEMNMLPVKEAIRLIHSWGWDIIRRRAADG